MRLIGLDSVCICVCGYYSDNPVIGIVCAHCVCVSCNYTVCMKTMISIVLLNEMTIQCVCVVKPSDSD